ncbi:MAG: hypothetical protein EA364_15745 [Balneolaceae bacterium]|nr:MAG: hypothetical protein EA364_15745 [Balneolaceae bacterium]
MTAAICTASLLFFANACNDITGIVNADSDVPVKGDIPAGYHGDFGQGYQFGSDDINMPIPIPAPICREPGLCTVPHFTLTQVSVNHTILASFDELRDSDDNADPELRSIFRFVLSNTSNSVWARLRVDWEVTGDNLRKVEISVNGQCESYWYGNISGSRVSGTLEFSFHHGFGNYTVTVKVTDATGSISETKEITI